MTQNTQTTVGRLTEALGGARNSKIAEVAAEIDRLTAERDEARAEVARLTPAAEAFGWWENYASNPSTTTWDIFQDAAQRARDMSFIESRAVILTDDQIDVLKRGIARAREAAKESQP